MELGFLEEVESWKLKSKYFPSKVGGIPSWLNLKNIPEPEDLQCNLCGKPCVFLMQIYSPGIEDNHESFHRTVFVFMCKNSECCVKNKNPGNFKVFRNQLPRRNPFYDFEPPQDVELLEEEDSDQSNHDEIKKCIVCGCRGSKHCAKCKISNYCSKYHQEIDWKSGHKTLCQSGKEIVCSVQFNLPEYDIVNETETLDDFSDTSDNEADQMKVYEKFMSESKESKDGSLLQTYQESDLEQMAMEDQDKYFSKFKKVMAHNPDQVIRYQRRGSPIWISDENIPLNEDIPNCSCGSKRTFEFQILPQILNSLKLDSIGKSVDWGTLVVYTCDKDCSDDNAYHSEVLWKQDINEDKNK